MLYLLRFITSSAKRRTARANELHDGAVQRKKLQKQALDNPNNPSQYAEEEIRVERGEEGNIQHAMPS